MKQGKEQAFEYRTRLHMDRPGIIKSRFVKDPSVRYIYKVDYQRHLKKEISMNTSDCSAMPDGNTSARAWAGITFVNYTARKGPIRYTQTVLHS